MPSRKELVHCQQEADGFEQKIAKTAKHKRTEFFNEIPLLPLRSSVGKIKHVIRPFKYDRGLVLCMRVLAIAILAVVFGWSGLQKMVDPSGFSLSVFRYHLLPYDAVNAVSLWIAGVELACAFILLFVPRLRTAALWMLLCLLLVFSIGIGINLMRGSHMACGCFSTSPMAHPIGWLSLLKNVGLIVLTVYLLSSCSQKGSS